MLSPGDHHQNGEADGGPGELGRWCSMAREMEDKADDTFPSGKKLKCGALGLLYLTSGI